MYTYVCTHLHACLVDERDEASAFVPGITPMPLTYRLPGVSLYVSIVDLDLL